LTNTKRAAVFLAAVVIAATGLNAPAQAAPAKPRPSQPSDAYVPSRGPRVVAKPPAAAGAKVAPLAAWSVSIGATTTNLLPTQWSTITATANQDVGPTPYYIIIRGIQSGGSWATVAICGTGTTCSVSVTRADPGSGDYNAYIARYPSGDTLPDVQAAAPGGGGFSYHISWRGIGIGLASDVATSAVGGNVTLTATVGENVGPTPFWIQIYDHTSGVRLAACGTGTSCSATVSQASAMTRTYSATVGANSLAYPPSGVISWSAATYVTWSASSFRLSLSAPGQVSGGYTGTATVTVTSNQDVGPTPYYILIFNQGTGAMVGWCGWGTVCSVSAPVSPGWNSHVAFLAPYSTTFPPANAEANSNSAHTQFHRLT
jgi:hypothetical protein